MTNNKTLTELEQAAEQAIAEKFGYVRFDQVELFILGYNNAIHSQNLVKMEDVVKVIEDNLCVLNNTGSKSKQDEMFQFAKITTLKSLLTQLKNLK